MPPQTLADQVRAKLQVAFAPLELDLIDESAHHAGHAGASAGGESHFRLSLVSARFDNLTRLARQRLVYDTLTTEIMSQIHALTMDLRGTK